MDFLVSCKLPIGIIFQFNLTIALIVPRFSRLAFDLSASFSLLALSG